MSVSGSKPWPDLDLLGMIRDATNHFVENCLVDVQARTGAAALSVVEEDRVGRAGNAGLHVGVVEHDVGRLAAELQRNLLQISGSRLQDELAHLGRAGERDLVDIGVRRQSSTGRFAVAGNNVDDAVWESGFGDEFGQQQRAQRSLFRRLQHHRASGGQRRDPASMRPSARGSSRE